MVHWYCQVRNVNIFDDQLKLSVADFHLKPAFQIQNQWTYIVQLTLEHGDYSVLV